MTLQSTPPTNFINVLPAPAITSGGAVLKIGENFLWVDVTGDLRIHGTHPSGDLSGAVVGAQT